MKKQITITDICGGGLYYSGKPRMEEFGSLALLEKVIIDQAKIVRVCLDLFLRFHSRLRLKCGNLYLLGESIP